MTSGPTHRNDSAFYASLGLVANPFVQELEEGVSVGTALEITAEGNRLLAAVMAAATQASPKPILVSKSTDVPSSYSLRAISLVESTLINDVDLNVLHAYIQLFMLRKGRVRSTLGIVAERLAFRSFEETLVALVAKVLEAPDQDLVSFVAIGEHGIQAFSQAFGEDPLQTVTSYFGAADLERRPELAEVMDIRLSGMETDVDEQGDVAEVDATVGDAPGTGIALSETDAETETEAESAAQAEAAAKSAMVNYVIDYVDQHMSRVVARGLRMYVERGLAALSTELKVTKAPRKTLKAVANVACERFDKIAIIYDGFDNWSAIAPEMRHTIVTSLTEMRWLLDGAAVFVLLLERDRVPELEEQFSGGVRVDWDFAHLEGLQSAPDRMDEELVNYWLACAARRDAEPMTLIDPVLGALALEAGGSLSAFVTMAACAIEDAAERGIEALDAVALAAGRCAENGANSG